MDPLSVTSAKIYLGKKIDLHAHIGNFEGWANVSCDADELIRYMDMYNVEKSAVFFTDNDLVRRAAKKYPERIVGCYWPDPHEAESAERVRTALREWGFKGVKLHPLFQAFLPNDKIVHPIVEEARKARVPVLIHTGHAPFSLPWSVGELAESFPDVKIVMLHMGDGNGVYMEAAINVARKLDNIYLETSRMMNGAKIVEALQVVGKDRVMYGSDIPFGDPVVEIVKATALKLSDEENDLYFYRNAKKLLKI
jgi:uncharacterized protein